MGKGLHGITANDAKNAKFTDTETGRTGNGAEGARLKNF